MSSPPIPAAMVEAKASPSRPEAAAWLREPLVHFLILGAVLFALDRVVISSRDDPRTIYVDAAVDAQARKAFHDARGREPDAKELQALRRVWLDNEVLYREGLAMGVDKGDTTIRDRVIFKALEIVAANVALPPIDDAGLRAWFEKNRARYDEPRRYDFQEAVVAGAATGQSARELADLLNSGRGGDVGAGLRVYKGRPLDNVVAGYGMAFVETLDAAPQGEWRVMASKDGPRAIRLLSIEGSKPADFARLRNVVHQDWVDATLAEQRSAAVDGIAKKYRVLVEER